MIKFILLKLHACLLLPYIIKRPQGARINSRLLTELFSQKSLKYRKNMEDTYKILVNDEFEYQLKTEELDGLDIVTTTENSYHVLKDNEPYHLEILKADFNEKVYTVKVNSEIYQVRIEDQLDMLIDQMGFALSSVKDVSMIEAPMPGLILDINVRVGQAVNEDDPLLILEAMKMENVLTSPRDGIIKSVNVKKGAAVDKKHILIEFE